MSVLASPREQQRWAIILSLRRAELTTKLVLTAPVSELGEATGTAARTHGLISLLTRQVLTELVVNLRFLNRSELLAAATDMLAAEDERCKHRQAELDGTSSDPGET